MIILGVVVRGVAHRLASLACLFSFLWGMGPVCAQDVLGPGEVRTPLDYVTWTTVASPSSVKAGESFEVVVDATIAQGWKMYAMDSPPPSFAVAFEWDVSAEGLTFADGIRQSRPKEAHDPWFDATVRYFTGEARFASPLQVLEEASSGDRVVTGTVRFMICNDRLCLPPTPADLRATVRVVGGSPAGSDPNVPGATDDLVVPSPLDSYDEFGVEGSDSQESGVVGLDSREFEAGGLDSHGHEGSGFGGFLLLAVIAGLASLLTPCVFPMIPLTISYFSRYTSSRSESVRMALVYGVSIMATFTGLGLITALLVGATGAHTVAANPWINLFVGLVFVVFACSLLGLFELRLPSSFLNRFERQENRLSGYAGVLFMGLTFTLVSFSCHAPFVGGLLAVTAANEWSYPVVGMAVFSTTFAMPFVLFALFPHAMQWLPQSGAWMNSLKVVLGFVEFAAAFKFLSNADLIWGWGLLSRPVAIALMIVIFGMTGFYLLGKLRLRHEPSVQSVGVIRLLFAVAFLGISLYMLPGLFGSHLNLIDAYLPPRQATDPSIFAGLAGDAGQQWLEDVDTAFDRASMEDKPVFIDFTGYTCTNCRRMETSVFRREPVASRLAGDFVLLRLYTDDRERSARLQRYQLELTGTLALPTYAIVDPHSEVLLLRQTGISSSETFMAFLDRGSMIFRTDAIVRR